MEKIPKNLLNLRKSFNFQKSVVKCFAGYSSLCTAVSCLNYFLKTKLVFSWSFFVYDPGRIHILDDHIVSWWSEGTWRDYKILPANSNRDHCHCVHLSCAPTTAPVNCWLATICTTGASNLSEQSRWSSLKWDVLWGQIIARRGKAPSVPGKNVCH